MHVKKEIMEPVAKNITLEDRFIIAAYAKISFPSKQTNMYKEINPKILSNVRFTESRDSFNVQ